MFEKLLLATDGSAHAVRAAQAAADLAKALGKASVTVFHVTEKTPSREQVRQAQFEIRTLLDERMRNALQDTERIFFQSEIPVVLEVAIGDAAEEIVKHAERGGYDLIVIGSRGLNPLGEMLAGSVSRRVIHEAGCPVMVVK